MEKNKFQGYVEFFKVIIKEFIIPYISYYRYTISTYSIIGYQKQILSNK